MNLQIIKDKAGYFPKGRSCSTFGKLHIFRIINSYQHQKFWIPAFNGMTMLGTSSKINTPADAAVQTSTNDEKRSCPNYETVHKKE